YKADALLATNQQDSHIIAASNAAINDYLLRDLLLAFIPSELITPLLPHFTATTTLEDAFTAIQNLWETRVSREEMQVEEARRVERFAPQQQGGQQSEGSGKGQGKGRWSGKQGGGMRNAADKYAGFERWRGGIFVDSQGRKRFKIPSGSCFSCFRDGHFKANCDVKDKPGEAARRRMDELKKDGISVPVQEASALFCADLIQPDGSTLAALVAGYNINEPSAPLPPSDDPAARRVTSQNPLPFQAPIIVDEELQLDPSAARFVNLDGEYGLSHPCATFLDPLDPLSSTAETALCSDSPSPSNYVLDSGATRSFTVERNHLHDYHPYDTPRRVNGAFGSGGEALGEGTLHLKLGSRVVHIKSVMLVPFLGVNLLSMTRMMMSGIRFSNNRTTLSLFDSSNSLITTLPIGATIYVQVI
ncbi:hypothetical protein BCR35DRAFT_336502, partial [Leucosporidium creatinivorum]